jgi:hypothetical protein
MTEFSPKERERQHDALLIAGRQQVRYILDGKARIEDFDLPSPGYIEAEREWEKSQSPFDPEDERQKKPVYMNDGSSYDSFPGPTVRCASEIWPWVNAARYYMEHNPKGYEEEVRLAEERVAGVLDRREKALNGENSSTVGQRIMDAAEGKHFYPTDSPAQADDQPYQF